MIGAEERSGVLPETFVHIAGIGPKTERRLWHSGVDSWRALRATPIGLRRGVAEALERSEEALRSADVDFFFTALPAAERWRAFADFGHRFVAVDIETTGMSVYDEVTVVGIEAAGEYQTFIRGANLEAAAEMLASAPGLITFNGALFDLPFLQRTFPEIELPGAHVDLRFLGRRVGLAGSLKTVEEAVGLQRSEELEDITGYAATVLWDEYRHGDAEALQQLVLYNAADTCVLRPLAELVVERLQGRLDEFREAPLNQASLFDEMARVPRHRRRASARQIDVLPVVEATSGSLRVGQTTVMLPSGPAPQPAVTLDGLHRRMVAPHSRIVGIDLTGSEARPTGWALLENDLVLTDVVWTDDDILARTLACKPRVVSIDSPLTIPSGRDCTDDACACRAAGGIMRHCERELKRRGVNVYPCLIQSMQALTRRGMRLAEHLRARGVDVIESYPGAAQDIMRIPRKRASQARLRAGLERFGVRGIRPANQITHDELDAVTSAVVGTFYLAGAFEALGNAEEDYLIIPEVTPELEDAQLEEIQHPQQPLLALVGAGARSAADQLGRRYVQDVVELDDEAVLVLEDDHAYLDLVRRFGARARGFHVLEPQARLPRRSSPYDEHRRSDDEDLQRALQTWFGVWRNE